MYVKGAEPSRIEGLCNLIAGEIEEEGGSQKVGAWAQEGASLLGVPRGGNREEGVCVQSSATAVSGRFFPARLLVFSLHLTLSRP